MSESNNRPYLPAVDQIRGLAALLVFFYHGVQQFSGPLAYGEPFTAKLWPQTLNPFWAFLAEGHAGVGLFIVLSGFILTLGCVGKEIDYKPFIMARVLRIYPLYILLVVFTMYAQDDGSLAMLIQTLTVYNLPTTISGPFTWILWAVAVEFQCYLIFPFLIRFSNAMGTKYLLGVIAVAFLLRVMLTINGTNVVRLTYWSIPGRIDEFVIGMIAARLFVQSRSIRELNPWWLLASSATVIAAVYCFHLLGGDPSKGAWKVGWHTVEGCAWAFFILTFLPASKAFRSRAADLLTGIGTVSYSFYLTHLMLIFLTIKLGLYVQITSNGHWNAFFTTLFVVMPLGLAFSTLLYYVVEKPFMSMRKKYVIQPQAEPDIRRILRSAAAE